MLRKEDVYINLQGKGKKELTDLWEFLNNAGEIIFNKLGKIKRLIPEGWIYCTFYQKGWIKVYKSDLSWLEEENKQEVTIEQLKEIIKPMDNKEQQLRKEAKERGYTHDNFKCLVKKVLDCTEDINKWHYERFSDTLYTMPEGEGGNVVYRDGVWAEIVSESLEQQLQKAEAEVKRLKDLIEEDNNIKIGDWIVNTKGDIYKVRSMAVFTGYKKITDQELINKLNKIFK